MALYNSSTLQGATVGGITVSSIGAGAYTTIANGSVNWAGQQNNVISNNGKSIMTVAANEQTVVLEDTATLDVKGTVKINGIDLEERLKTIERVLAIPERDVTMEAKYPSLKKKFDDYINTLEKYRTFERVKGDDNETT